jgi:2-keto-4-pentenoate hydratase/2-oxohepta-3-ene-1,7-dioic acid hydratase in catechol pathway
MREPKWSLSQFISSADERPRLGVLTPEGMRAAPHGWPDTATEILDRWREFEAELITLDPSALALVPDARPAAAITYPRKVICAGANYYDHAAEMGTARPDPLAPPYFFLKPPTTTIVGDGSDIPYPDADGVDLDWEAELAVVIADRCKVVSVEQALNHVAGYTVANDISARGLFARPNAVAPAFQWNWYGHKALDGFCPIGPGIVPAWLVSDPSNLVITLSVNGVPKQNSSTAQLVVGIAELVAAASQFVTLEPGDLILTGTPAGVGLPRKEFLKPGDEITVEIEGIGQLANHIVAVTSSK